MEKQKKTIEIIAEREGLTLSGLAKAIGAKPQNMYDIRSGKVKAVSSDIADLIVNTFPKYSKTWLITGEGKMTNEPESVPVRSFSDVLLVPVVNLDARGGFGTNEVIEPEYVIEQMPFSRRIAKEGDFVIPVYGDSMHPKYPSGSYVLIRNVPLWREYLELGAAYVLDLVDDRRLIKNVLRSSMDDSYRLESVNPKYEPTDIPKRLIRNVFRVLMSVRRETM